MKIPNDPFLGTNYIGKEEIRAVNKVLKSKSLFRYHGPKLLYKTDEFEKQDFPQQKREITIECFR